MPNRCVAQFCSNTSKDGVSVHYFPKIKSIQKAWIQFVQVKRADFIAPSSSSVLCSKHFKPEDYESATMQAFGFKGKSGTRLKEDAVPTLQAVPPCTGPGRLDSSSSEDRPAKKARTSTVVRKRKVLRMNRKTGPVSNSTLRRRTIVDVRKRLKQIRHDFKMLTDIQKTDLGHESGEFFEETPSASCMHTPSWQRGRCGSNSTPCSTAFVQIISLLEHMKNQQDLLVAKMNYIISRLPPIAQDVEVAIPVQFPLMSMEEVESLEDWLKNPTNSQQKQSLSSSLAAIGGHDTKHVTWNILAHMFHNEIGKMISWKGANGKKRFNEMASKTLLLNSVRKSSTACASTEQEVCKHAIRWFNLAADRSSRRRRGRSTC